MLALLQELRFNWLNCIAIPPFTVVNPIFSMEISLHHYRTHRLHFFLFFVRSCYHFKIFIKNEMYTVQNHGQNIYINIKFIEI